jgi:hypothetical protein
MYKTSPHHPKAAQKTPHFASFFALKTGKSHPTSSFQIGYELNHAELSILIIFNDLAEKLIPFLPLVQNGQYCVVLRMHTFPRQTSVSRWSV